VIVWTGYMAQADVEERIGDWEERDDRLIVMDNKSRPDLSERVSGALRRIEEGA
jgi:hypothetical protein